MHASVANCFGSNPENGKLMRVSIAASAPTDPETQMFCELATA